MSRTNRLPTLFIPHGGGPCFFMETPPGWPRDTWDRMEAYLRGIPATLPQPPRALLVISGHWLTERPTVNVAARPTLLYDYYGFPEHTYRLTCRLRARRRWRRGCRRCWRPRASRPTRKTHAGSTTACSSRSR